MKVFWLGLAVVGVTLILLTSIAARGEKRSRVLIIDGNNPYHDWQVTTPLLKKILENSGRFTVDVATLPMAAQPPGDAVAELSSGAAASGPGDPRTAGFRPQFKDYDVVLGNYVGPRWPAETEQAFAAYVAGGGGYVCFHSANNAFPDWKEYNEICGLGGWLGRDEGWGPYVFYDDAGKLVRDDSPGPCGHHGPQHEFAVDVREPDDPIMRGLPARWMHAQDELYDSLRGPAKNMHVLATAYSAPEYEGTGRNEPMLMTVRYGNGRVFFTALGHADYSIKSVDFITTLLRGTEWAATGGVTIGVPDDFPSAEKSRSRE
jgi:uncharacterized protein